ncbi:flagellar hook-basal body complex protein [Deferribacteraceae bacterium V6Fe1]|nr:flagellar hook-basal body complex protein [Deferribacteraceae bacterium V6Fe1]
MLRSLYAGVTGLQQHQKSMDVVGNNIANVNTVGYKGSRVVFSDLMSQTLSVAKAPGDGTGGVNAKQIGLGSKLGAIDVNFNQGTLQTTGVTTDLALQGDGFFVVKSSNTEQAYYTRAGNFTFDKNGYLVTPSGLIVQGWMRDLETNTLSANGPAGDIRIDEGYKVIEPRATTEVKVAGNLSTEASPTILSYQTLLSSLDDADTDLSNTFGYGGERFSMLTGETIRIKADANLNTQVSNLYNEIDQDLGLAGSTIQIFANGSSGSVNIASTDTLSDVITKINNEFSTLSASLTLGLSSNGILQLSGTGTVSFAGGTRFINYLSEIDGTLNSETKLANTKLIAEKELVYGEDIKEIGQMIDEINALIQNNISSGFQATFDSTTGKISYDNTGGSDGITGFTIEKSFSSDVFSKTFDTFDRLTTGANTTSETVFRYAKDTDTLDTLYSETGEYLNISTFPLEVSAVVGGVDVAAQTVQTTDTLQDLMAVIENEVLGFRDDTTGLDFVSLENGVITVKGEKGIPNSIDNLVIKNGDNTTFNNYMQYSIVQNADGGQLITSQSIYDSQGNEHIINYQFDLYDESRNIWKLSVVPAVSDENVVLKNGQNVLDNLYLQFNPDGSFNKYMSIDLAGNETVITNAVFDLVHNTGAYTVSDVNIRLGTTDNFDGLTLTSRPTTITQLEQDGYKQGTLEGLSINRSGEILGTYDNGEVIEIGIVGIARFNNNEGLLKMGDSLFAETVNSGTAVMGKAGLGGRGVVEAGALENSNVDLAQEFVTMITTQRGYQANSRVITTSDEMLQELMSLKR